MLKRRFQVKRQTGFYRRLCRISKRLLEQFVNSGSSGCIIGRGTRSLRNYDAILKRYFGIKEVAVL